MKYLHGTAGRFTLGAAGAVVIVVTALAVRLAGGPATAAPPAPSPQLGTTLDRPLPDDIAHLPLTDETGKSTDLAALQGKVVVLTDFMTLCQEICPITTAVLNQADQAVTNAGLAGKVQFVDITVDPARDTPQQLHAYRSFAKLLPNWTLLTGSPDAITKLWKYFGVFYKKIPPDNPAPENWRTHQPLTYDIEHSDVLTYLDTEGHQRFVVQGMPDGSDAQLTTGERAFLSDNGRENLNDPSSATWTEPQALTVVSWLTGKRISAS